MSQSNRHRRALQINDEDSDEPIHTSPASQKAKGGNQSKSHQQNDKHHLEVQNNKLQAKIDQLERQAKENEEQRKSQSKKRKHRSAGAGGDCGGEVEANDEEEESRTDPSSLAKHYARKFVYTKGFWVVSRDTISAVRNKKFDSTNWQVRFKDQDSIEQGQVHDIHALLPFELREKRKQAWFVHAFWTGIMAEHGHIHNRLRSDEFFEKIIGEKYIKNDEDRQNHFLEDVGFIDGKWQPTQARGIHAIQASGKRDASTMFRGERLFRIWAALTRAKGGLVAFLDGTTATRQGATIETVQNLRNQGIQTAAIAACGILSRWMVSRDENLTVTGVCDWQQEFHAYHRWIESGLQQRKVDVRNTINEWNRHFYPRQPLIGEKGDGTSPDQKKQNGDDLLEAGETAPPSDDDDNGYDAFGGLVDPHERAPSASSKGQVSDDDDMHSNANITDDGSPLDSDGPPRKKHKRSLSDEEDEEDGGEDWGVAWKDMPDGSKKKVVVKIVRDARESDEE